MALHENETPLLWHKDFWRVELNEKCSSVIDSRQTCNDRSWVIWIFYSDNLLWFLFRLFNLCFRVLGKVNNFWRFLRFYRFFNFFFSCRVGKVSNDELFFYNINLNCEVVCQGPSHIAEDDDIKLVDNLFFVTH